MTDLTQLLAARIVNQVFGMRHLPETFIAVQNEIEYDLPDVPESPLKG
jgi:hypothetical protein